MTNNTFVLNSLKLLELLELLTKRIYNEDLSAKLWKLIYQVCALQHGHQRGDDLWRCRESRIGRCIRQG